jgi:hypothetical protein
LILGVGILVLLALTTANMGIAVRQKWMALVPLLVFISAFLETKLSGARRQFRTALPYQTARPPQRLR